MRYFSKLIKNIIFTKRDMSSLKLFLWENVMFVNSVILPGEIEKKYMITTLITIKNNTRRLNMCRKPDDTVVILLQRFALKIQQAKVKKKINEPITDCIFLKVNGQTVPDETKCSQVFDGKNINISLEINDKTLSVMVDLPIINDLLLGKPYKCLMLYPYAFDKGYNVSILKSKYTWYRVKSNNVVKVGNSIAYIPSDDDIKCKLKLVCEPCNEEGHFGPTVEVLSEEVVDNIIDNYPFEKRLIDKPSNSFRVLSYNILAEDYTKTKEAKNEMYPYCSASILASSYRNPLLLKELTAYEADILCLQEVELKFFNRVLVPLLKHNFNLNGVHCKKDGNKNEGSSCFFSADKFVMLEQFNIKLNDHVVVEMYCGPLVNAILNDDQWKQGLLKKTVLQILLLETRCSSKHLLLVCNTHLISDPDGDSIRLLQSLVELAIIKKIKKTVKNHFSDRNISVIFCGDFNSTPESGVYDLVTNSLLPEEHRHCAELNNLKDKIDFKMYSAYSTKVDYSNFTQTFFGLLDYIYFTEDHLKLLQVLPMPSHEEVIENVGLPSVTFPSDHLALIADFKFK
ncbi:2',5'-phosphodiesterase 12 isoform X2 [Adelges cooleyi]|nr:2',5'-phosphodiesterase 12 isoform X2 [Adelges cooleyi]XP_050438057.1 2',5'-phosphodiesterase 12 isoform X2 [Adelges cooleyi]